MAVRTFAVVPFDMTQARWLIDKAAEVALGFDAHLIALHPFNPVVWVNGVGADPTIYSSMLDWEEKESAKIRALCEEVLRRNGLPGEFRAQTSLYGAEGFLMDAARAVDVVILGATDSCSPDDRLVAQRVVRESGRPALVLGQTARLTGPAKRVVIGWTDTRESARAAHDVLGLVAPGAEITLLSCHARASELSPGLTARDDLAAALDRAGFRVTVSDRMSSTDALPEALIRFSREVEAELLATGAFGHSQIYDLLVGAVTRDLLDEAAMPVLLSH